MATVAQATALVILLVVAARAQAPAPPTLPKPAVQATAVPSPRIFGSEFGLVLNFIKPDKTADFEAVIAKLKEALAKSDNPERKEQAASWRVLKSSDPAAGGSALYVFIIDPAVKGADYTVSKILGEAFPKDEVSSLFKLYSDAYAQGQNFVSLTLVSELGK